MKNPTDKGRDTTKIIRLRKRVKELEDTNIVLKDNIKLLDDFRNRLAQFAEKIDAVSKLSVEINTLDIDRIINSCINKVSLLFNAKYSSLFFYNSGRDELILRGHNHPTEINRKIIIKHHRDTVMGVVLRTKQIILIRDFDEYERDHNIKIERTFADKYVTKSCISAPLISAGNIVGIYNLSDKIDGTSFDELNDLPIILQLSQILGVAIQNYYYVQEIESKARTDSLTKLDNYRSLFENLRKEIHRTTRYFHPLTIVMIDIDNFKKINDDYGHLAGDAVLRSFAKIIKSYVRKEDLAARYGGDEFTLILPETPLEGGVVVANRLKDVIESNPVYFEGEKLPQLTISAGVATYEPPMSPTEFVRKADQVLLLAKSSGKNRVEKYQPTQTR